ncbi:hypothetical protein H7827_09820 [Streptomyces sp. JH002]|uniref:hypothetical protein n=1 Tax=Streptomyces TaxID=1883 RepID=UPI001906BE75|nr:MULTISPECIES: hypothetical protein [unclassified Streptomyces]MCU4746964.1 hypothetical protein [Streptomyces sp. G-5]QQN77652.1 hypothetical protein IPZ77_09485 [Streptomyces sp. XC 2026]
MPIAIAVTSADLVLPATDPHTPAAHVLTPPGGQDFPTALAEAAGLLERHGYVIAVYPATTPRGYVQRLHAVRAMLESDRIALLPTSLPPLGAAVLVRQLRQLSVCDFSPGVLGAAARLLSHYIYAGALLGSASRTDRLPVALPPVTGPRSSASGPHAVLARPTAQLVRASGVGLAGPQFATTLTYAPGQLGSEWVTGQLARQWQVQGVHPVPLPEQSPSWWRTNKLVEFAAAIQDASVLYQMVSSMRQEACHWCGFTLIGDRCAFCSAPVPAARDRVPRAIGGASGGGQRKALAR